MPKNLLQDMVRIKRVRAKVEKPIVNTEAKEPIKEPIKKQKHIHYEEPHIDFLGQAKKEGKSGGTRKLWIVAFISLVFLFFALSYAFSKATVTINPKIQDIVLNNENLSASKNGAGGALAFNLVVISGEEDKMVETTLQKDISQIAQGAAVLYNAFSSSPQTLSINTKLEGSNGKIYKTQAKIIVPGMQKDGTPGSVEVSIYAAEAGEAYNSAPLDFKIAGFKGTPKYAKFYGRSKGAIIGGLKGKFPSISPDQRTSVITDLKTALQAKLLQKATDQIPDGFILFKDAVYLITDDSNTTDFTAAKDTMLPVKLTGTLYGLLFNENELTKKIAKDNIKDYDGSPVFIKNIRDLSFHMQISNGLVSNLALENSIDFTLSGTTKIVWKFDESKFTTELLGKSKKDFNQILLKYPAVASAKSVISPFWRMSFPDKSKNIKVIVNYPN
ncbi:MAG TPA: hypothetical protein VGO21_01455 [Candidatus Paceibacterota bacterium]|jgi:hypothetical protein|nr:hypothetical protein [Candidatus Paceibacterota bacterium]